MTLHFPLSVGWRTFSILERIVVVETPGVGVGVGVGVAFSILERIVVVETRAIQAPFRAMNGFQYPRTDRGG